MWWLGEHIIRCKFNYIQENKSKDNKMWWLDEHISRRKLLNPARPSQYQVWRRMKAVSRQSIVENFLLSATTSSGCQTAVEVERAVQTMRPVGLRDDLVVYWKNKSFKLKLRLLCNYRGVKGAFAWKGNGNLFEVPWHDCCQNQLCWTTGHDVRNFLLYG